MVEDLPQHETGAEAVVGLGRAALTAGGLAAVRELALVAPQPTSPSANRSAAPEDSHRFSGLIERFKRKSLLWLLWLHDATAGYTIEMVLQNGAPDI